MLLGHITELGTSDRCSLTDVAWFVCLCVTCLPVGHIGELCKNGLTDQGAIYDVDLSGLKAVSYTHLTLPTNREV